MSKKDDKILSFQIDPVELSENAKIVIKDRYLLKNKQGETIETTDQMFLRVANFIGSNEGENKEKYSKIFFDMMRGLLFIPNSPTLMNSDTDNNQLAACISGDTMIYTDTGLKRMDKIVVGDMVLTHLGRFKPVTTLFDKGEKPVIELKRWWSDLTLTCTKDHKILDSTSKWRRADRVMIPFYPEITNVDYSNMNKNFEDSFMYRRLNNLQFKNNDHFERTNNKEIKHVYDIEVEEDHSFVAGDFVCHNCYVIPLEDNMENIFEAVKENAIIQKSGGGVGISFSNLRPKGDLVESSMGSSSGAVSFIDPFNAATGTINQGGKRRGI